ncbi:hypothetical protein DPMN_171209 [Dreissena polymorpha]|uniref:Uncharacterized protein n=1 Tax=Dreissena polymorpha TaxID=45954 RepID=A0A9D4E006_DREPO|nr:hypothetical protein DPMN_171209 [Dreissena polymorpha]
MIGQKNVTSRVFMSFFYYINISHVIQLTETIFELNSHIKETNVLTKCHENWAKNVTSRKNAPPTGGHVFFTDLDHFRTSTETIFELIHDIIETNLLTKKNAPPPGYHVFQPTGIIFEVVQDIIGMILLTKFHEDRTINVKNAPPLGIHVFQANVTIFKLNQVIIATNLLTGFMKIGNKCGLLSKMPRPFAAVIFKQRLSVLNSSNRSLGQLRSKFHEDREKKWPLVLTRKNAPTPGGHVFQPTGIIFELVQDTSIIGINLLTKKNAPPLGSHIFQANTNLLIKFHEDWQINVASRELTRQMLTPHNGHKSSP